MGSEDQRISQMHLQVDVVNGDKTISVSFKSVSCVLHTRASSIVLVYIVYIPMFLSWLFRYDCHYQCK